MTTDLETLRSEVQACVAESHERLIAEIMDSTMPKNEQGWAARREIESLRERAKRAEAENARLNDALVDISVRLGAEREPNMDDMDWHTDMIARAQYLSNAEAELAALKARTEWQPIATAPKDETWIYVCRAGQPHSGTKVKFSRDCGGCPESWWDGSGFYRNPTFTHWMPLPPPPKGEE